VATQVRDRIDGQLWPESTGKVLTATFVPLEDAIQAVRSYGEDLPSSHSRGIFGQLDKARATSADLSSSAAIQPTESNSYIQLSEKVELSLDDIFKRTKKEPSLYYLPRD
jgi:hypothetical protein